MPDLPSAVEAVIEELLAAFDIHEPPIPVERMLQNPLDGMWDEIDISQISGVFYPNEPHSPRMSLARWLVRHLVVSDWGQARGLLPDDFEPADFRVFARALMMPRTMLMAFSEAGRTPERISSYFEVPLADAERRLTEL